MLTYTKTVVPDAALYVPRTDTLAPNTPTAAALEGRRQNVVDQIGQVLSGAGISVSVDGGGVHVIDTDRNSPLFGTTLPQGYVAPNSFPTGGVKPFWQQPAFLALAAVGIFLLARKG